MVRVQKIVLWLLLSSLIIFKKGDKMRVIIATLIMLFLVSCNSTKIRGTAPTHRIISKGFEVVPKEQREEKRIALVIGNQNYQFYPVLNNPRKDATDMTTELRRKGFEVIPLLDATQMEIQSAIEKFSYKLRGGGTGVFYYSGHGTEVDGNNYLLPIDSKVPSRINKSRAIALNNVMAGMKEAKNRFNIVILDACRSRPDGKGGSGGLASPNSATGVFVAYATYPGGISEDGEAGGNGLYTKHLLKELRSNNSVDIKYFFDNVGQAVNKESEDHQQLPWTSSSMYGKFYFSLPKMGNGESTVAKLQRRCDKGNARSCYNLGVDYIHGSRGVTKNIFQGLKLYDKACKLNDGGACSNLGFEYWKGRNIQQDYKKAVIFYQRACELNDGRGCANLGVVYGKGQGVTKDFSKALNAFSKGCNIKSGDSCVKLGCMYEKGEGTLPDHNKAISFYKKSCDLNEGHGCRHLAYTYSKNINLSKKYYEKGCSLKDGKSCTHLGDFFYKNQRTIALKYYEKACNLGIKKACQKF